MEEQPQTEDVQTISHQHDNGEIFEANNLEAARGMCPVLGKMSLEEAGLLLELETMGKEQMADQQKVPTEKAVIEKVEKVQPEHDEIKKIAESEAKETIREIVPELKLSVRKIVEPVAEEIGGSIASKPVEADLYAMLIKQAEAARIADNAGHESAEVDVAPIVRTDPAESLRPISNGEGVHRQVDAKVTATVTHHETQITVEEQANAKSELLSAHEATLDPAIFESEEEADNVNEVELAEPRALMADEQGVDFDTFEATDFMPIIEGMEPNYFEYNDGEELPLEIIDAALLVEDKPTEFIQAESLAILEIAELPAPVAQIETTMAQLEETLENDKDETAKINTILEEIIALPTKLEVAVEDEEKVLVEKLEELFIELFEETGISYSPDLIESFVKLTKSHYLEQLLEITANTEEAADLPHEIGTREFLQKLQHGLSAMKQAVINFYELGKSIMRLYTFSYQTANFRVT